MLIHAVQYFLGHKPTMKVAYKEDEVRSTTSRQATHCAAFLLFILVFTLGSTGSHTLAQPAGRYFPETGKTLSPEFISFYDAHGGVPIFGYPLTDAETEGGYKVQYLERARGRVSP